MRTLLSIFLLLLSTSAFAQSVGVGDTEAPKPDPATFAQSPTAVSQTSMRLHATPATDRSMPVKYCMRNTTPNTRSLDTGWITESSPKIEGLTAATAYAWDVRYVDSKGNLSAYSAGTSGDTTAAVPGSAPDIVSPYPSPPEVTFSPTATSITLSVLGAGDEGGSTPIEYRFFCVSPSPCVAGASGWQTSNSWVASGLTEGQQYSFRVQMKDSQNNLTIMSDLLNDVAEDLPDTTAPAGTTLSFSSVAQTSMTVTAAAVDDNATGGSNPVEYLFTGVTGSPGSSSWQTSNVYNATGLTEGTTYGWTVTTRDSVPNTGTASSEFTQSTASSSNFYADFTIEGDATAYSGRNGASCSWNDPGLVVDGQGACVDTDSVSTANHWQINENGGTSTSEYKGLNLRADSVGNSYAVRLETNLLAIRTCTNDDSCSTEKSLTLSSMGGAFRVGDQVAGMVSGASGSEVVCAWFFQEGIDDLDNTNAAAGDPTTWGDADLCISTTASWTELAAYHDCDGAQTNTSCHASEALTNGPVSANAETTAYSGSSGNGSYIVSWIRAGDL